MTPKQANSNITFKKVDTADLHLLGQIEVLASVIWTEHYSPIIGVDQVNYMLKKFQSTAVMQQQIEEGYRYVAVFNEKELIGYFSVQPRDEHLFLSKAYLQKESRGFGVFSQMLNEIIATADTLQKQAIELTVNKYNSNSIAIYQAKGFEITQSAVFDIGNGYVMDDYVMKKEI